MIVALIVTLLVTSLLSAASVASAQGEARCFKLTITTPHSLLFAGFESITAGSPAPFLSRVSSTSPGTKMRTVLIDPAQHEGVGFWLFDLDDLTTPSVDNGVVVGIFMGAFVTEQEGNASVQRVNNSECVFPGIHDGRLNDRDLAALAFIYPTDTGFAIWEWNAALGSGVFSFDITQSQVDAALAEATDANHNVQIGSNADGTVSVWALTSGQCQMNYRSQDGSLREFIFDCAI